MKIRVITFDNNKYSYGYNQVFERDYCLLKEKKVIYILFDVKIDFFFERDFCLLKEIFFIYILFNVKIRFFLILSNL